MSRTFRSLFVAVLIIGGFIWIFGLRLFDQAANSLVTSSDASASQVQGLVQFVPASANQGNTGKLQVNINGLQPNSSYEVTLDQGHCGATRIDLGAVTSDTNGNFYNEFPLKSFTPASTWYVNIHQNPDGTSVACGQLQTNSTSSSQIVSSTTNAQAVPNDQGTTPTPTSTTTSTPAQPSGLPNTGADPGDNQQYDNNRYPRKY